MDTSSHSRAAVHPANVFGFIGLASVAGKIFDDANANGVDDGEGGISGRVVSLYGASGVIETDTTDDTGGFSFASQRVGFDYTVCVAGGGRSGPDLPGAGYARERRVHRQPRRPTSAGASR